MLCYTSWIKFGLLRFAARFHSQHERPTECKGSNRSGHIKRLLSRESNIRWILHWINVPNKHFIFFDISSSLLIFISSGCIPIYHAKYAPYTAKSTNFFQFHEICTLALVLVRPAMLIILTVRSNGFVDSIKCYFTTEIIQVTPLTCAILCSQYSHKHSRI